ncbi:MAG: (Fe-S)-binding protein [Candidatus Eisenbacteria bacterium]
MAVEPKLVFREPLGDKYPEIAKASDEIVRCIKCGLCRAVCPTLLETLGESQGARGRVSLVEAVLDGRLSLSDIFEDRISTCINCKACVDACPSGVRVDDIILRARAELVSRGRFPFVKRLIIRGLLKRGRLLPPVGKLASMIQRALLKLSPEGSALKLILPAVRVKKERHLPVFARKSFREGVPARVAPDARAHATQVGAPLLKAAYFVGCSCNLIYTSVAVSTVDVLTMLGVEVSIPRDQGCCGTPVFNAGDFATARDLALKNMEAFRKVGVDAIVVSCASCGLALRREYSKLLGLDTSGFSEKVMDVSEFIVRKVGLEKLGEAIERARAATEDEDGVWKVRCASKEVGITAEGANGNAGGPGGTAEGAGGVVVTYHDPCHLARGQGVRDEPRRVIAEIPGVVLREMEEPDRCCGGGGLYSFTQYDMSRAIVSHKVEAIRKTGAQLVLTSCPGCIMQLQDALLQAGVEIRVMHVAELLGTALRGWSLPRAARAVV